MIQRVISLQPSATSTIVALGMADKLAACTRYCADVAPEVRDVPVVADSWSVTADEIARFSADLVIASVPYRLESLAEILKAGVRVLAFAPRSLSNIYGDIEALAGTLGVPERGRALVEGMEAEFAQVRERAASAANKPRVFCEAWGKPILRSQAWVAEMVEAAGGVFLGGPGAECSAEDVRAADPDIIIAAWCGAGDRVLLEKIVTDRGWHDTAAARLKRVYCLPDEFLNTPGPPVVAGLHALAGCLHPQIFPAHPRVRRIAL